MREVIITAKFVTGTTITDPNEAEAWCRRLLVNALSEAKIASKNSDTGIFSVEIVESHSSSPKCSGH